MTINPKILAAVSGAVAAYIADEEAACQAAQMAAQAGPPAPAVSLWALAGRSEAMQMRLLMQRRSFR